MNVVDSSAWLEYFADTVNAKNFAKAIEDTSNLVVPTIVIYEVFRKTLKERNKKQAVEKIMHMKQGWKSDLSEKIALSASKLSVKHNLPMADSIIYATAQMHEATLWTQDSDFKNLPGVKYFSKK